MNYEKVSYPENKPDKEGEYHTNNGDFMWHPEYGGAWYLKGFKESDSTVKWFYKPVETISLDKLMKVIENVPQPDPMRFDIKAIAAAIFELGIEKRREGYPYINFLSYEPAYALQMYKDWLNGQKV